ncbi:Serine/threonine-protein phosphatase 4 regulatory subunit 4 [Frankliniella fusca]|uniref:Serine/threonine-protein phosphatase 4 regulatory subunit 4 n=1 Tax=Frankliniella fusca TaxID=407009 RepID=A0AAE1GYY5_9NEOP|nr:Serine/threonine-protein phosphatase 4 regulatory subunit 4 [Frankliniella fusca]
MSTGDELQRLNIVEALPHLLSNGDPACIDKMVPKLQQALPGDGAEFHMIASNTFRTILEQKLVPPSTFTQTFLSSIVASIDSRDPYLSKAWLDTLLDIIELLPPNVVKNDILPVAVSRGQLSQSIPSRVTSCELLGKIATKFDCTQLQKEIVPLAHSLCQDVSGEVRGSMCHQLPCIARGLSPEATKPALLPLLVELSVDEELYVRIAAVHAISELVSILSGDVLKHTIIPLLQKLCEQAISEEDRVLCAISEKYGQICIGLKNFFSENEMSWCISFFREMTSLGLGKKSSLHDVKSVPELIREKEHADLLLQCRINCAYNFPGIALLTGPSAFEEMLHSTYTSLSCDHSFYVRRIIAAGIHEVFKVQGAKCLSLKGELFMLLSDESRDVLQALVPNLSSILDQLSKNGLVGPTQTDTTALEILRHLLKCEASLSLTNDWRLHSAMLSQLECFVKVFPSDLVFSHLPVILFHRIQDSRALPCRLAAAHLLLVVLRYTSKLENQNEIRQRIFTELCIHHSCHTRLLFVKMCGMALDIFSSSYIKEHFFLRLLTLAVDPIPNVRLVLCGLLPHLRRMIKLPHDSNLLSALVEATEKLQNYPRPDRDVLAKLHSVQDEMESIALNGQDSYDTEDFARYQEEQNIEMKSSAPEPRRLVTVNMKTLGEGKRATLVSLRGPEISRTELRQTTRLPSSNDKNISSSIAVSSVGLLGGHAGNESRITASITSTTSDSSPSFSSFTSFHKDPDSSFNSITQVGNESSPNYRALTQTKKESSPNLNSYSSINKKEASISTSKSWSQQLTHGSRLPLPLSISSRTNKPLSKPLFKQVLPFSDLSELDISKVYMIISHINSGSKMPLISANGSSAMVSPTTSAASSTSSPSSSLLSSSYPALLEEEFYIDAGVPLPEKLTVAKISSSSFINSDPVSKIPSLRELLFQNSTLLAQVANRSAASENAVKSLSYGKSLNSCKVVEQTSGGSVSNSNSKRYSRLFEESASSDFRYSNLIGRPVSTYSRKDNAGSSLLPKPTPVRNFPSDSDSASGLNRESSKYNSKMLPTGSSRVKQDSKIGVMNRRSLIYYSSQGNDGDGGNFKDQNSSGLMRNGKPENSAHINHMHTSHDSFEVPSNKVGNSITSKISTRPTSVAVGQTRAGSSKNTFGKISAVKAPSLESANRRFSSLDSSFSQTKERESKTIVPPSPKRYSLSEKSPGTGGVNDKKVSLSSIGVKGVRRSFNPGQRPHSCFIMTQQNEKSNGTNSRSMSQESLGIENIKLGAKMIKKTSGFNRSETRLSRIPRGGTSCHSSPGNSRSTSPIHEPATYITVSHTAPCSARVSRSSSPTENQSSRVSLASIKLQEPSRLPIRKYNHHL